MANADTPEGYALDGLLAIGFSEYEARAYLELLRTNPAGSYELAKASGIPSSKIYQTMARLAERGYALPVSDQGKTRYVPLEPGELLGRKRQRLNQDLDRLEAQLRRETRDQKLSYVWNITDYADLTDQLRVAIGETRRELVMSLWYEELAAHQAGLVECCRSGVKVAIVQFGAGEASDELKSLARIYRHPIEDTLYAERGGRGLAVASDGGLALMATVFPDRGVEGAWSRNHGFVILAEDYIKHDIYLMKIVKRMDGGLTAAFGPNYRLLRDVFTDHDRDEAERRQP